MSSTERATEARKKRAAARSEAICELFLDGRSIPDIAARVGISTRLVECRLIDNGLRTAAPSKARMTAEEIEKARRMLDDGQSYYAVGEVLGRAQQTIERNVPGYAKLTPSEAGERAALVRQLHRLEKKL